MKSSFFILFVLSSIFYPSGVDAFNVEAKARLKFLFEKQRAATKDELIYILLPIADDTTMTHMEKIRDMSFVVYISGHELSKGKRDDLFYRVFQLLDLRRREDYIKTHPGLDEKTETAIRKSAVFVGMSKEHVKASLGQPEEVRLPVGSLSNIERWFYYTKRMKIYFKEGVMIKLKKR